MSTPCVQDWRVQRPPSLERALLWTVIAVWLVWYVSLLASKPTTPLVRYASVGPLAVLGWHPSSAGEGVSQWEESTRLWHVVTRGKTHSHNRGRSVKYCDAFFDPMDILFGWTVCVCLCCTVVAPFGIVSPLRYCLFKSVWVSLMFDMVLALVWATQVVLCAVVLWSCVLYFLSAASLHYSYHTLRDTSEARFQEVFTGGMALMRRGVCNV